MTNNYFENKYSTKEKLKQQIESDRGWYFITFVRELPSNRPYGFTLFNEPFVLFEDVNKNLVCCSLASEKKRGDDRVEVRIFTVVKKQGGIWLLRGKTY